MSPELYLNPSLKHASATELDSLAAALTGTDGPRSREITRAIERNGSSRPSIASPLDEHQTAAITWPAPEPIEYGDKLTSVQLNASAAIPGTLVYTPAAGYVLPAGKHSLWVTFTPSSGSVAPLQTAVTITVAKATPTVIWSTPEEIACGEALDAAQLNATASIPGNFDYSPGPGEVLAQGSHTLSVTFAPTDSSNYEEAQASVSISVAKAKPTITWPHPDPITYGALLSDGQLSATASVPGSFEYFPGVGSLLAAGEHILSVVFTPDDLAERAIFRTVVPLTVTRSTPEITWPQASPIQYGTPLSASLLAASANVPGTFAYTPAFGESLAPGEHTLSVTFTPWDSVNYITAHCEVSLKVSETFPVVIAWPAPAAILYGTALSSIQFNALASVPGSFAYTPAEGHILAPGRYTLSATFTPSDAEKYTEAHAQVQLDVEAAPDTVALLPGTTHKPVTRIFTINDPVPAAKLLKELTSDRNENRTNSRETRTYKGAVYEKGEDRQWHLLQR